jgi:hypothetical protein
MFVHVFPTSALTVAKHTDQRVVVVFDWKQQKGEMKT